jgi:hypothetical protein
LYLTKSILDSYFDLEAFKEGMILDELLCLHDANRGDKLTIDLLQKRWVTFWRAEAKEVGSAMVTWYAYDDDAEAWFWERPFAQPLSDIREYFGEKVALYFSWLGHYTIFLIVPALLGAGMLTIMELRGFWYTKDHFDWFIIGFGTLIILWAAVYKQSWERECSAIALKWGTRGFESAEKDRPQFTGELQRSAIDNRMEQYYPESWRMFWSTLNMFIVGLLVILNSGLVAAVFYADYLVTTKYTEYQFRYYDWVLPLFLALLMQLAAVAYLPLSRALNDLENHRTETEYEDALIKKALFFDIFNSYGALCFLAFGKSPLFGTCDEDCIWDVAVLLYAIFIVRGTVTLWRIIFPIVWNFLYPPEAPVSAAGRGDKMDEETQALNEEPDDNLVFMEEVTKQKFDGTVELLNTQPLTLL